MRIEWDACASAGAQPSILTTTITTTTKKKQKQKNASHHSIMQRIKTMQFTNILLCNQTDTGSTKIQTNSHCLCAEKL